MKAYYIKLNNEVTKNLNRIELKKLQSVLGYKLVDYVAKKVYKIENHNIIKNNNKPEFENSNIHFNISHSNQIIIVAFDKYPLGIDIEFMKERDFEKLGQHYNLNTSNKTEFYKKWTQLEAEIKIQSETKQTLTKEFENNYMLSIKSSNPEPLKLEIKELSQQTIEVNSI